MNYDEGGVLPAGTTVNVNNTGEPEPVLADDQWSSLQAQHGNRYILDRYGERPDDDA